MIDFLKSVFTQENITFALSVFGSVGTVWAIVQSRRKMDLIANGVTISGTRVTIDAQVVNRSRLSVCVTDVVWTLEKKPIYCNKGRYISFQESVRMKNADMHHYVEYSQPFPLQISGLGGVSASLRFEMPEGSSADFAKPQSFQIQTNRGVIKVSLLPPRP